MDITRSWASWATFALLLTVVADLAVADPSGETSPCPGAAAWRESHRDQLPPAMAQRDEMRTFAAPELRSELQRRFEEDQRQRQRVLANLKDLNLRTTCCAWMRTICNGSKSW
jgi:hypothetical protein